MPPPTPNIGQLIGQHNTGWAANVTTGSVTHTPATLESAISSFTTTQDGQVVQNKNVNGPINVKHNNVTVKDCKAWMLREDDGKMGMKIMWCEFGRAGGNIGNTTQIVGGDYLLYRTQMYGGIDHTRPNWGNTKCVENWYGPPWACPNCHDGQRAHCDPCQPHNPPSGRTWDSLLIQGNRYDLFIFESGETYTTRLAGGSKAFDVTNGPCTAGPINAEYGSTKNVTIRDNYIDGNYSQFAYVLNNPKQGGEIRNVVFIDNILKKRGGRNNYGSSHLLNGHNNRIVWGRNVDADTAVVIPGFYTYPNTFNATIVAPGPSTSYPTFYNDNPPPPPPPNPVISLKINSPAAGSTHTSGTVLFHGEADTTIPPGGTIGDSNDNYNYFDYYVAYPDPANPDNTNTAFLDHDTVAANSGFTFTVTSAGTVVTDRSDVQHTILGAATLVLKGLRKDGTSPEASISVTFGDVTPPPPNPNPSSSVTAGITADVILTVNTDTGGVPASLVRWEMVEQVTRSFRKRHYRNDTGRTVRWNGTIWVED